MLCVKNVRKFDMANSKEMKKRIDIVVNSFFANNSRMMWKIRRLDLQTYANTWVL